MQVHRNAKTTPASRAQMLQRIDGAHWTQAATAAASGVSVRTVAKWVARYRADGVAGLEDRSCRPHRSPRRTPPRCEQRILALRAQRWVGRRIAVHLGLPYATVARVLQRHQQACLRPLAPPRTGVRYEWAAPGGLLHVDVKKLGRIRGVGHRIHGDRRTRARGVGWEYVHVCLDDHSRVSYVEVLADERGPTCASFLQRAVQWFRRQGVHARRVLSDNAGAYHSRVYRQVCGLLGLQPRYTQPYHPWTNGKAERFIQTLTREWAYGQAYTSSAWRTRALPRWLAYYNTRRPHGGIGYHAPFSRLEAAA